MDSKINLEEFILHQLDWSLERKSRLETKAVGYITAVALIIGVLGNFIGDIKSFDICPLFKWFCFGGYILLFLICGKILYLCSRMLLPREIGYFDSEKLIDKYWKQESTDKGIITACQNFIRTNEKAVISLKDDNKKIAKDLKILVIGFICASITFFTALGVAK